MVKGKMEEGKRLVKNTIMLYLMTIARLVIPLISLPYLTRVLTVDCYGSVSFVKSIMSYFQIAIDFGFLLSATKDIVEIIKNGESSNKTIGDVFYAQSIICFLCCVALGILLLLSDILKGVELFAILSLLVCCSTIFLFEYVFKAYENMEKIAVRFIVMKLISLILTIIFVKSDKDILLIPIFDLCATLIAVVMVFFQLKKMGIKPDINFKRFKKALAALKSSFVYFISNFATTAFTALSTVLIGLLLTKKDVAYWAVAMQLVTAIQALYSPIITSAHPAMLKSKNLNTIHKIMLIYMPLILVGCALILLVGDIVIPFVLGEKYRAAVKVLKYLVPLLIISFPAMLYGWPCLDAINKTKETTISTIIAAVVQVLGLVFLLIIKQFSILAIALVRNITELTLCAIRMGIVYSNKSKFNKQSGMNPDSDNEEATISLVEDEEDVVALIDSSYLTNSAEIVNTEDAQSDSQSLETANIENG